ncbi:hypothetical protein IGB42_00957 [Andreprevotia sp. IGB-42]|uniref:hypothetical protein n=1 Tax=Andreprevotia sp. IGB-42 TaxID=2497473 RepID=UPI0013576F28|nr:hypothetical protein [Andreprevotia sp. IGB-42]KAF0814901.1 hypothetical protein IGB42_00957 [Andreprevotia sp. IGB-42]
MIAIIHTCRAGIATFLLGAAISTAAQAASPVTLDDAQTRLFLQSFSRCDPALLLQLQPALESAGYVFEPPQRLSRPIEKFRSAMVLKADTQDLYMLEDKDSAYDGASLLGKDGMLLSYTALKYRRLVLANGLAIAGLRLAAYNDTGRLFYIVFFGKQADARKFNTLAGTHGEAGSANGRFSLVCSRAS